MPSNPYTLVFGREPLQLIPRVSVVTEIVESFCQDIPSQQVFLLSGVRGSGKTVLMTEVTFAPSERRLFDTTVISTLFPCLRQGST